MITNASLSLTQALRIVPGFLPQSSAATDRSPPWSPPKSRGLGAIGQDGHRIGPTTFGGTAVLGEATDGDGDENSSRELSSPFKSDLAKRTTN